MSALYSPRIGGVLDCITPSRPSYRDLAAQLEGLQAGRVADSQHRSQQFGLRQDGLRYRNHARGCQSKTPRRLGRLGASALRVKATPRVWGCRGIGVRRSNLETSGVAPQPAIALWSNA